MTTRDPNSSASTTPSPSTTPFPQLLLPSFSDFPSFSF
uniref:Uncharacterized protein MANES_02G180200 n=1 Tax=Rhizophora mucronata TaxID=61149 RepID=A0A2P2Q7X3_RHIMU